MYEYILKPYIEEKPWGGKHLNQMRNLNLPEMKIGETWECSTHRHGESTIDGKPLSSIVGRLKFLVKLIHAEENLSIQVHPNDQYAQTNESDNGKDECWYVVKTTKSGAGIYLGFKEGVSKDQLEKDISSNNDLSKLLNFIPVKEGDFFIVPAGTIHAIGEGVILAEVQQSSGITYRLWDWNRVDESGRSRRLDIDKALDVVNFHNYNGQVSPDKNGEYQWHHNDFKVSIFNHKLNVSDYTVEFQMDLKEPYRSKIFTLGGR